MLVMMMLRHADAGARDPAFMCLKMAVALAQRQPTAATPS
jgi:hypothetical protein